MFIVGFVTADEAAALSERGYEVEDASNYGLVSDSPATKGVTYTKPGTNGRESYLMAQPEPGPACTQAIAVFVDASVYDTLKADLFTAEQIPALAAKFDSEATPVANNSLDVETWLKRRDYLRTKASLLLSEAENFKYCSHKNPDGSDARYPIGNGERGCGCGNKWD